MVSSACEKCGEVLRHSEDDVPPSGMVVKCPKCREPVTVMPANAAGLRRKAAPARTGILDLDDADLVELGNEVAPVGESNKGLPDLPAPVAGRSSSADLPAPVARRGIPDLPAPVTRSGLSDLPSSAPKSGLSDLPAPVTRRGIPDLPDPVTRRGIPDLPAPVTRRGIPDLPAPVTRSGLSDLPSSAPKSGLSDLPAPVAKRGIPDLPAPVTVSGMSNMVTPAKIANSGLLAPKSGADDNWIDLPAPVGPSDQLAPVDRSISLGDLPGSAPRASSAKAPAPADSAAKSPPRQATMMGLNEPLESPLGGFDLGSAGGNDPLGGGLDLGDADEPLGGGFDLGNAGGNDPLGGGLDLGGRDEPRGGGFELGNAGGNDPLGGGLDLGGADDPLGGGLDLGGADDPLGGGLDLGGADDPLGGGLDLGGSSDPLGGGLDLGGSDDPLGGGLDLGGSSDPLGGGLDLGGSSDSFGGGLDLGGSSDSFGGGLDLGGSSDSLDFGDGLDLGGSSGGLDSLDLETPTSAGLGLDLPEPTTGPASKTSADASDGVVTFGKPSGAAAAKSPARFQKKSGDSSALLDLDDSPLDAPRKKNKQAARAQAGKGSAKQDKAPKAGAMDRRQKIGFAALGIVMVGAGGFYGLQYMQSEKSKSKAVGKQIADAKKHLSSDAPDHWNKAIAAAEQMLAADPKNIEAAAILALANYASAMEDGSDVAQHLKRGGDAIKQMRKLKGQSSYISLAEGLHALAGRQYDEAIAQLQKGISQSPKNTNALLYLGWAQAGKHDHAAAITSFDAVLAATPGRIAALYGKAGSLVYLGQDAEAQAAFLAVTTGYRDTFGKSDTFPKDHIGGLLGIAQLATVDNFGDREKRYLEILERPDLDKHDPRAVARAHTLAADEARKAGRLSVASERYGTALKLDPGNLEAIVGQAAVAIAKMRLVEKDKTKAQLVVEHLSDASEKLQRVLAFAPRHVAALLLLTEVRIAEQDTDAAANTLASLFEFEPKVQHKPTLAKMELLRGRILAGDPTAIEDAIGAYQKAIELSEGGSVEASLELAALYTAQDRVEDAKAVLAPLREKADSDAALAVSLGVAYMGGDEPVMAIEFFRKALAQDETDAEARFLLGRALISAGRDDEAIVELARAYERSEKREDIGLALAEIYYRLEKFAEAKELYKSIQNGSSPSRNALAKIGAYYVRIGDLAEAVAIGEALLVDDPKDPAGLYLTGEGLFAGGKLAEARDQFLEASKIDPQADYFEALGRAYGALQEFDKAIAAFDRAITIDKGLIEPRVGKAEIRLARKEYTLAIEELTPALELDPRRADIHYQIARSHFELRDYQQAVNAAREAVSRDPKFGQAYMIMGQAYSALEKKQDAARAFSQATRVSGGSDEAWVTEAYRLLGYAIREAGGSEREQYKAFRMFLDRYDIDDAKSKEVRNLIVSLPQ